MNFFDAAAHYVSLGWYVFPLKPGSKEPWPGSRGVLDATDDGDTISLWAVRDNSSNIGIACGKSGLIVLDFDLRHGSAKTIAEWTRKGLKFPPTVYAKTRSGGDHLFYRLDKPLPEGWKRKLPGGVDIQTGNKYVVAAPSVITDGASKDGQGGQYTWIRAPLGGALPPPPQWFLDLLRPAPMIARKPLNAKEAVGLIDRRIEGCLRKIGTALHGRNNELNNQAHLLGRMIVECGISREMIEARLTEAALAAGLEPVETRLTIRSGINSGIKHANL